MTFLIILGVVGAFAGGFLVGRYVEEKSNIKEIQKELDRAMEEERQRLVAKATKQLQK